MLPYLLIGAAAVIAFLALRKKPSTKPLRGAETTIVVSGTPQHPEVGQEPELLEVSRGRSAVWHVEYRFNGGVGGYTEVSVRNVRLKQGPHFGDPFEGRESDRKNKKDPSGKDPRKIADKVRRNAKPGLYKYDIYLNDVAAMDPDIRIREG